MLKKYTFLTSGLSSILAFGFQVDSTVKDEILKKGCVDCHFVYQAEFLPKRSWEKMFQPNELANHFGKKVELSSELRKKFLDYYLKNSCDSADSKAKIKINESIESTDIPLQITKVPYITSKHEDLKKEIFSQKDVKTASNCTACHRDADKDGNFDKEDVKVPNWKKGFFGWKEIN